MAWSNLAELPIFSNVSKEMGTETKRCPDTIPENSSAVFSEAKTQAELQQMPINLVVCADVRHVVIRISDLAHGIPRHVGSRIWSCLGRILGGEDMGKWWLKPQGFRIVH